MPPIQDNGKVVVFTKCYVSEVDAISLHWRHNDHGSVSNHQPHGCLLNRLFRRRSKKTSKLRGTGLCVGNSPGPVNSPHKGPVTRKMFPFDDVIMMRTWVPATGSKVRDNNYTQQYLREVIACPCPCYLLLAQKLSYDISYTSKSPFDIVPCSLVVWVLHNMSPSYECAQCVWNRLSPIRRRYRST